MVILFITLSFLSLLIWLYLLFGRHDFWKANQRLKPPKAHPESRPHVTILVPARNEEETIGACLTALAEQTYPGSFDLVIIDDNSDDHTRVIAKSIAERYRDNKLNIHIVEAAPLKAGWTGKLGALHQGLAYADTHIPDTDYLWLTDADIVHESSVLTKLVYKAEADNLALISEMVRLNTTSPWERLLIPAFVFFFQKLYPFPAVNEPKNRVAGAAGGSVLLKREVFVQAGGFEAVRNELIDDCAIAALIKQQGHGIWLGHGLQSRSIRPYSSLKDIWRMVARTAYHQLDYSPWMLSGAILGMTFTYLVPPVMVVTYPLHQNILTAFAGIVTWLLMAGLYAPTLNFYRQNLLTGLLLPFTALLYTAMTVTSAVNHWRGKGGEWKKRTHQASG